jgi:hypothetical protein
MPANDAYIILCMSRLEGEKGSDKLATDQLQDQETIKK